MASLRGVGRIIKTAGNRIGRGIVSTSLGGADILARKTYSATRAGVKNFTALPKTMDNNVLKTGLLLGGGAAGFASAVGPAAKEAALDVALGSPDADVAFTGRDLDARFIAGSAMGGALGGALSSTSSDIIGTGAYNPGPEGATASVIGGGFIGTAAGAGAAILGARKFGTKAMFSGTKGMARKVALSSASTVGGGVLGAGIAAGSLYGGAVAAERQSGQEWMNESVFSERARNSTASISAVTRATGDIVFGMHNTRGGM
jgi:hypothetical protein